MRLAARPLREPASRALSKGARSRVHWNYFLVVLGRRGMRLAMP